MIYIFDDRYERRESNSALINKYKQFVSFAKIECTTINELEDFILGDLHASTLILLHSSYRYPGDILKNEEVIASFSLLEIPIILFSGGFMHPSETMILGKYMVYNINSLVMYQNLEVYLRHLMQGQSVPLDILIWGESYIQNIITRTQSYLFRTICNISHKSIVDDALIDKLYAIIDDYLRDDEFESTRNELLQAISYKMTCEDLMQTIQEVTDKTL